MSESLNECFQRKMSQQNKSWPSKQLSVRDRLDSEMSSCLERRYWILRPREALGSSETYLSEEIPPYKCQPARSCISIHIEAASRLSGGNIGRIACWLAVDQEGVPRTVWKTSAFNTILLPLSPLSFTHLCCCVLPGEGF